MQFAVSHQCEDGPSCVVLEIAPLPVDANGRVKIHLTANAAVDLASLLAVHALAADRHARAAHDPTAHHDTDLDTDEQAEILKACRNGASDIQ